MGYDGDPATELDLYADNTSELYPKRMAIIANLKRKIAAGRYKASAAPKLWAYWYTDAAKRYAREFGGEWSTMFPKAVRDRLARERAKDEYERIRRGEHGPLSATKRYGTRKRSYKGR